MIHILFILLSLKFILKIVVQDLNFGQIMFENPFFICFNILSY